jgi:hypothetical protein
MSRDVKSRSISAGHGESPSTAGEAQASSLIRDAHSPRGRLGSCPTTVREGRAPPMAPVEHPAPMTGLEHLIRTNGGLIATHELMSAGFGRATIRRLVDEQQLWRIRQGWYAAPGTDVELTRAARVGGVITCSSALRRAGIWATDLAELHVRVAPNACQLRAARDRSTRLNLDARAEVVVHWRREEPWAPWSIDSSHDADPSVRRLLASTACARAASRRSSGFDCACGFRCGGKCRFRVSGASTS